jgi:hypothetical protein
MAHRTDGANNVANLFDDGGAGVPGTTVEEAWLNMVQEELCNLIEACGITLVKGTNTQLLAAAVAAATANKIVRRDAAGRAKVVDGSAADDIATKGQVDGAEGAFATVGDWSVDGGSKLVRIGNIVSGTLLSNCVNATTNFPTIPVGFRPDGPWAEMHVTGFFYDATDSNWRPCRIVITVSTGEVAVAGVLDTNGVLGAYTLGVGDQIRTTFTFPVG